MSELKNEVALSGQVKSMLPFSPQNLNEALTIATKLASSDLCPKSFGGKPENVLAAIMMGHELGLGVMQALTNIAVVNGRASVWGELVPALIHGSGQCEYLRDTVTGEGDKLAVTVTSKRKGQPEYSFTYTWDDAKRAGLTAKDTYQKHPKDMLYYKALGRVSKRYWADVMKGIAISENMDEDLSKEFVGAVTVEAEPTPVEPKKRGPKPKVQAEAPVAPAAEVLNDVPAEPAEVPMEDAKPEPKPEPMVEATQPTRVIGTMIQCVKLMDIPNAYAAKVQTAEGEVRYLFENLAAAQAAKPLANRTVTMMVEPLDTPIAGVRGKIVKCEAVA